MKHTLIAVVVALGVLSLTACGEKPQTASARKSDVQAWQGAANDPHVVTGWKAGDAASWEEQMRNRAQNQNEYTRTSAPSGSKAP